MRDLRLVLPAVAVWALAAGLVGGPSGLSVGVAVVGVLAATLLAPRWRAVGLVALLAALVAASCAWRLADVEASPLADAARTRALVTVEAQVARDPRRYERFGVTSSVVELRVLRATLGGRTTAGRDTVVAFLQGPADDLEVGERLVARGRLGPADDTDTVASLRVVRRSSARSAAWWWRAANRVRVGVRESMARSSEEPRALVPALVDGDDAAVSEQVQDDFRQSGLTHLLAVSGTNLTIVVGVVMMLLSRTRAGPRLRLGVGLVAVLGFVLLARPDPSVVRAAAMGVVGLAALGLGSRGGLRVLAVAVIGLLVADSWLSRTAGFVLSVCATAGILVLGPPFTDRLSRWMPRWAAVAVAVPCAAQLACTPAVAALSGE
ncbi:MAG: ComEC/Rec2 family competence protein, partial [Actinomycetales bacterium]